MTWAAALPGGWFWLTAHVFFLIGFRNRAAVLLSWAWNYLFAERAVRIILPRDVEPGQGRTEEGVAEGTTTMSG